MVYDADFFAFQEQAERGIVLVSLALSWTLRVALQETTELLAQLHGPSEILLAGNLVNNLLPCPGAYVSRAWARRAYRRHNSGLLVRIVKRLGANHRCCISDEQPVPKVFDALMENKAQLRQDIPNLHVIVRGESLSTQNRDSFFESHGENGGRNAYQTTLHCVGSR